MNYQRPAMEVSDLRVRFPARRGPFERKKYVHAVNGVSLHIASGETLSIVGESGCGKSTLGRAILGLVKPASGIVRLNGSRIDNLSTRQMRPLRRSMQVIFQDPYSSLNPRHSVKQIIGEPLRNFGCERGKMEIDDRIAELLQMVSLPADAMKRFPHEFSGGQRQRIAIARALATGPEVLICDEPVSALDVSVKAQITNLLVELQERTKVAMLFISHDLAIVEHLTHRVAVMYLGKIVEVSDRQSLFGTPRHPYTRSLLSAVPNPDPIAQRSKIVLPGETPSPINLPSGCAFHNRCPHAFDRCRMEEPKLRPGKSGAGQVACHLDLEDVPTMVGT